jgi:hypothetical protein
MKKVIDNNDFIRDDKTKALINTNAEALHRHRIQKQKMIEDQKLREDVDDLKQNMNEIKSMLAELIKNR